MRLLFLIALLVSPTAQAQFAFHAATHIGIGRMGDEQGQLPNRSMGTFDLQFSPGYRIAYSLMPLLLIDYRLMSQLQNESAVGSDWSGTGLVLGLGLAIEPGPVKFTVSYDFRSRHNLNNEDTHYRGSGYHFIFGYEVIKNLFFDLQYTQQTYNSQEVNGVSSGRGENPIKHWNFGLGLAYRF